MNDRWIRAALLLGFAMLIAYFNHTGQLSSFVEPNMEVYVKLSSLGLLAAAMHQAYEALKPAHSQSSNDCECGHTHHHYDHHSVHGHEGHSHSSGAVKSLLIYGLFLLPLLLGFLLPGSSSAAGHAFHPHTHDHSQDHIRETNDSKKDR
ncbi:DUF1980 domain-containing protein [Paenibacillus gorillae]|uniref:DUF1980 domain-containing protein n=1 Tax=Paenibacillus gorillae TaxID=1243662 RepID=UPI0004B062AD|nr:DUF1980 domain-containing protein [Paenibacillus gorillae]